MAQREINARGSVQQLRGVNQRTSPVRVEDGFFVSSTGVQFGVEGYNVDRMSGKATAGYFNSPVLGYFVFGSKLIVQTLSRVFITDATQLYQLALTFIPFAPGAVTISNVSYFTLTVTTPGTLPTFTATFSLQRSPDNATWTTIATGLSTNANFNDSGLTDDTLYYYRAVSVSLISSTPGPSSSVTTVPRVPDAPVAPTFSAVTDTTLTVTMPVMPAFGVTMNLQRSPDNATWTTLMTGMAASSTYNDTGLTAGTQYYYRAVAVNTRGTTNGASGTVTTRADIVTSTGVFVVTSTGSQTTT